MKKTAAVLPFVCILLLCAGRASFAALSPSDYSQAANWMSVPQKADKAIDLFFLYPSTWRPPVGSTQVYADINDAQMRAGARDVLEKTSGMFDHIANIYAPYYRQSNAATTLGMTLEQVETLTRDGPGVDALAAFQYYLKHYNQGRPFILASHSQGSSTMKVSVLGELLAQDKALLSRMIAAYSIGWTYTSDYLAARGLRFAQGPDDTGVIISWNTEAPGVTATNPVVYPGALVINPIIWTTSEGYAEAVKSLGSSIPDYAGSDGRIDALRGVVINTTLNPAAYDLSPMFPYGSLHAVEWELYFYDVFQNAITRSLSYFTPAYNAYTAELGNERLQNFSLYLRSLLDHNPKPGSPFFHPVHSIFFRLAGQPDVEAFTNELRRVYSSLTPQATGQALVSLSAIDRSASEILRKELRFVPEQGRHRAAPLSSGWSLWARPLYHSGRQKGDFLHTALDAEYAGFSAGLRNRMGRYCYGIGLHAGKGDFEGSEYNADIEGLGIGLGITRNFHFNDIFALDLTLTGGYSHYTLEQGRDVPGDISPEASGSYASEPSVSFWKAALFASNEFPVTEGFRLRPEFGLSYVSANMEHYTESGGGLALAVAPEHYESFRSSIGLALHWQPLENMAFSASGHWHHEFADESIILRSSLQNLAAPAFSAKGRALGRDNGSMGLGLEWSLPTPLAMHVGLDYVYSFSRTYTSNEVSASFSIFF